MVRDYPTTPVVLEVWMRLQNADAAGAEAIPGWLRMAAPDA